MARKRKTKGASPDAAGAKPGSTRLPQENQIPDPSLFPVPEKVAAITLTRVPLAQIFPNEWNANVESLATFEGLKNDIRQDGFDEAPQVVPMWGCTPLQLKALGREPTDEEKPTSTEPDTDHPPDWYRIIGGEWRTKALRDEGYTHVDVVVKHGWDELRQRLRTISRNLRRGDLDDTKFTQAVNDIVTSYDLEVEKISEEMGFESLDKFLEHYQREEEEKNKGAASLDTLLENTEAETANIDNLNLIVTELLRRYGDTLPDDYMHFFFLRRAHLLVRLDEPAKKMLDKLVRFLKAEKKDAVELEEKGFPATASTSLNDFLTVAIETEIERRKRAKKKVAAALETPDTAPTEGETSDGLPQV